MSLQKEAGEIFLRILGPNPTAADFADPVKMAKVDAQWKQSQGVKLAESIYSNTMKTLRSGSYERRSNVDIGQKSPAAVEVKNDVVKLGDAFFEEK